MRHDTLDCVCVDACTQLRTCPSCQSLHRQPELPNSLIHGELHPGWWVCGASSGPWLGRDQGEAQIGGKLAERPHVPHQTSSVTSAASWPVPRPSENSVGQLRFAQELLFQAPLFASQPGRMEPTQPQPLHSSSGASGWYRLNPSLLGERCSFRHRLWADQPARRSNC